jgi:hypothetical protein
MKTLWLISGLGLGAGLVYLLDPEQGEQRRDLVRTQLAAYGRQTEDLLGSTTRAIGQPAYDLLTRTYVPFRSQPGHGERRMTQSEQRGMAPGLFMLGCVGLGVALISLLEPSGGPRRRALVRDTARTYWHKTAHALKPSAGNGQQHTRSPSLEDEYVARTE